MVAVNSSPRSVRPGSELAGDDRSKALVIGIVQPQPLMRVGLETIVSQLVEGGHIHPCASAAELLEGSSPPRFDVVITELNLRLPECSLSSLEQLRKSLPKARILVLSPLSERQFGLAALRVGANGFLPVSTSLDEFARALQTLIAGGGYISSEMAAVVADEAQGRNPRNGFSRLSPRELDVIRHLIWGMQLKTIAATLGLNIRTASCYKKNALGKLGMNSIAEVVRYSSEQGFTV